MRLTNALYNSQSKTQTMRFFFHKPVKYFISGERLLFARIANFKSITGNVDPGGFAFAVVFDSIEKQVVNQNLCQRFMHADKEISRNGLIFG